MRLVKSMLLIMLFACIFNISPSAHTEKNDSLSRLPLSLKIIGEEAFAGTALNIVILPPSVKEIGDRAFANVRKLNAVYIPPETSVIGKNAFAGTTDLVVYGQVGSYAESWAKKNGYRFEREANVAAINQRKKLSSQKRDAEQDRILLGIVPEQLKISSNQFNNEVQQVPPKDNPEMQVLDYRFP